MRAEPEPYLTQLTPLSFLERAAGVFPDKTAVVYQDRRISYQDLAREVVRLAHALRQSGVRKGDRIAYLCPNIPQMLAAHFAVPLAGGVLVAINTRLSGEEVRQICDHSGATMLFADTGLQPTLATVANRLGTVGEIVSIVDHALAAPEPAAVAGPSYEELLARGRDEPLPWTVDGELDTIAINYTSGTTGRPKGVMYSHRGAYLNSFGEVVHSRHSPQTVYLWTLPMFHCNGWCTTWAVTAVGGTHVCLREVRGDAIWKLLDDEGVTHLNGAPTVLTTIANAPAAHPLARPVVATTAGAPPSPTTIQAMEELGFGIVHVYGLTETYGPHSVCEVQPGWPDLRVADRARLMARQGVAMIQAERLRVVDSDLRDVPADGETMGEIVMRGNNVMTGYFNDPEATAKAFAGGWFHSGDLGVMHPDGYVELRDRAKDIIVSGGENISTVEVEQALMGYPAVLEVAVIAVPDQQWGERPKAFVVLKPDAQATEEALIAHVRDSIARYKAPKSVEFVEALPKTATGKVQKFELREKAWAGHQRRIQG